MLYAVLKILAISIAIPAVIALGLILSQPASGDLGQGGLDFGNQIAKGSERQAAERRIAMRDGFEMSVWEYPARQEGAPLLVLVHGSGWHSLQMEGLAEALRDVAHVITPDLRGHGANPGRRGDVDYIGQLEDDLGDLIAAMRRDGQKVVLGGHSSGGGLVVRFAGGKYGDILDGAVLLAPFLKYNAPTTRPNSGGWAVPLTRRIIGLSMLNAVRIRALNGLTAIRFRVPPEVLNGPLGDTATQSYSYRMNTSFAPRSDYLGDVAALPDFLLIAGREDEAFVADAYQPTLAAVTDRGRYRLVDGVGHLDIVDAAQTRDAMAEFLRGFARK